LHNQRVTAAVTATASLGLGLVGTMPQNGIATQGENKWLTQLVQYMYCRYLILGFRHILQMEC